MGGKASNVGQVMTMALFALSVFAIALFLWLSFGGQLPLKPQGYRFKLPLTDGPNLVTEADVRISGVNVGKVKTEELDKGGARSLAEIELEEQYAPIPADTKAILREKTLLGESYIELSPGSPPPAPTLKENTTLPQAQVDESVQFDEILRIFDPETKQAYREWMAGTAAASRDGAGEDLNDAFGNLAPFAVDGADLLEVLDSQRGELKSLINDTGEVFGALSEGDGILRGLIVNSEETFEALADEQSSLEETFRILPTFLDESRLTVNRLDRFARNTNPLVNRLKPVAARPAAHPQGPGPALTRPQAALHRPAPADPRGPRDPARRLALPARTARRGRDARNPHLLPGGQPDPLLRGLQLRRPCNNFFSIGGGATNYRFNSAPFKGDFKGRPNAPNGLGALGQFGIINDRTFQAEPDPAGVRSRECVPATHWRTRASGPSATSRPGTANPTGSSATRGRTMPPCFIEPDELFDGNKFARLKRGEISRRAGACAAISPATTRRTPPEACARTAEAQPRRGSLGGVRASREDVS